MYVCKMRTGSKHHIKSPTGLLIHHIVYWKDYADQVSSRSVGWELFLRESFKKKEPALLDGLSLTTERSLKHLPYDGSAVKCSQFGRLENIRLSNSTKLSDKADKVILLPILVSTVFVQPKYVRDS